MTWGFYFRLSIKNFGTGVILSGKDWCSRGSQSSECSKSTGIRFYSPRQQTHPLLHYLRLGSLLHIWKLWVVEPGRVLLSGFKCGSFAINSLLMFHHLSHYESWGETQRTWSEKSIVIQSAEDLLYFHLLIMTWSLLLTCLLHCLDWNELSLRPYMLENGFIELPMTLKSHFPLKRHRNIVLFICCNHNIKIWLLLSLEICIHTNIITYISPCFVPGFHWSTC